MVAWSSQRRCRRFTWAEIEKATDFFNNANHLGKGGEGTVFKGVVDGGQKSTRYVAVKRLKCLNSGAYEKEIEMLSELDHDNVISLVGYCQQPKENILVYEFMPNGSLGDNLYRKGSFSLSWEQRLNICIGAARGLEYLHTGISPNSKIIHRDVKPDNILLDEKFEAKISDFGLSKKGPVNLTHSAVSTALGRGTPGYFAPEYLHTGKVTRSVDVYAFGVVLFQVLCKKRPWENDYSDSIVDVKYESYGKWAQQNVDPDLKGAISQSCLEAFIDIAEKCVNRDHPDQRPSMSEVVSKLNHACKLQKSSSRSEENGGKRPVDSGDFRISKSVVKFEDGNKITLKLGNSTKASEESKARQETQAYGLGAGDDKHSDPAREEGKILNDLNSEGETKNKEDGRRDDSNGYGSRTLPDIPGTEDKVVLYYSTSEAVTDYMKIRLYLNMYKVDIDQRDPRKNEEYQVELSRFFEQKKSKFSLPQLFIGGKHIGGANEVVQLYNSRQLEELMKLLNTNCIASISNPSA